ncbi:hypothetical protein QBC34DRAFT_420729 [Podospora aff. communis PSN243]|uniref:Mitochondrial carrier protein pet8 n=1 Tax=Podospora aff. communis PSN243 TaxID=3040156 RepID=A0AAV9H6A6_9PEZI|nr:hypothetical protein QBC34DRAFT_420729 [Podospora aff. communis PSN243]
MSASRFLLRRPAVLAALPSTSRPLTISAPLRLKESASSDPSSADFDKHKQDSIEKQKRGQGHWKPELASNSEESIKADRMSPGEAGKEAMKQLQEKTKGRAEETAKHGTSMKDM